jgi:hypothetical protein
MAVPSREKLLKQLAQAEAELAELGRRRGEIQARVEALMAQLEAMPSSPAPEPLLPIPHTRSVPTTPLEKVRLFWQLFRGREDVFPTRFVSKRTGRAGYAPACANKFVRGACELPRVRCGECPSQAFVPVADQVVLDHLHGQHVMGVYPLLENDTCWFLAADFDKASWQEDVRVFAETC